MIIWLKSVHRKSVHVLHYRELKQALEKTLIVIVDVLREEQICVFKDFFCNSLISHEKIVLNSESLGGCEDCCMIRVLITKKTHARYPLVKATCFMLPLLLSSTVDVPLSKDFSPTNSGLQFSKNRNIAAICLFQ